MGLEFSRHNTAEHVLRLPFFKKRKKAGATLYDVIPPEIKNDAFYELIKRLSANEPLTHVLEIGSSAGGGSTEAFVNGLSRNPTKPSLYCIEVSRARFDILAQTYAKHSFVRCYNLSTLSVAEFPAENEVIAWYNAHPKSHLARWPIETVLTWLRQDIDYVRSAGVESGAIARIKKDNAVDRFDMVLIDGSEFTGSREYEQVRGARIVLLDDTETFKCHDVREQLLVDPAYEVIVNDPFVRNGYAAFRLK